MRFVRRPRTWASVAWLTLTVGGAGVLTSAWLAGLRLDVVESESMAPTLHRNSLAVIAPVRTSSVEVGDVLSYRDATRGGRNMLHRVVEVHRVDGSTYFETRGDANNASDSWLVSERYVDGRLTWRMRRLGAVVRAMRPTLARVPLVIVPLALLVISEWRARRRASIPKGDVTVAPPVDPPLRWLGAGLFVMGAATAVALVPRSRR